MRKQIILPRFEAMQWADGADRWWIVNACWGTSRTTIAVELTEEEAESLAASLNRLSNRLFGPIGPMEVSLER